MMRTGAACLLLSLVLTPIAYALTLDDARQQGRVGETFSGYLDAVQQDVATQALVAQVNAGRQQAYQQLAAENGMTTVSVARLAGEKLVQRAAKGDYVRGINGQWLRKTE